MTDYARHVLRHALMPLLPTAGLTALAAALARGDDAVTQGPVPCRYGTRAEPRFPTDSTRHWEPSAADPVAFCGWKSGAAATMGECEDYQLRLLFEAEKAYGEWGALRHWLGWWADAPREEAFAEMLAEVALELGRRGVVAEVAA